MPVPVPIPNGHPPKERELPRYLQGIVDTCFEEGHYDSGLSTLAYMCSPTYRQAEHHLRYLLYLALYPQEEEPDMEQPSKRRKLQLMSSPAKARSRSAMPRPTPEHSATAVTLLHTLVRTNTPASCASALPIEGKRANSSQRDSDDEGSNEFGDAAKCVSRARNAWELLMPGVVKGMDEKAKKAECSYADAEDEERPKVLADHAVPALEWLVTLWEADAAADPQHHPALLLAQLPAPSDKERRQEVNMPMNVIGCLLSNSERRSTLSAADLPQMEVFRHITLAARLLSLLVACALTSPPSLSPSAVVRQTSHILPDLPTSVLQNLLNNLTPLSPTQAPGFARFKTALLALFLAQTSVNGVSEGLTGGTPMKSRVAPAARPTKRRPRALRADGPVPSPTTTTSSDNAGSSSADGPKPAVIPEAYPVPSPTRIIELLALEPRPTGPSASYEDMDGRPRTPPPRDPASPSSNEAFIRQSVVKLLLLRALDELHVREMPLWTEAIQDGRVGEAVESGEWWEGAGMREMAGRVVRNWAEKQAAGEGA